MDDIQAFADAPNAPYIVAMPSTLFNMYACTRRQHGAVPPH